MLVQKKEMVITRSLLVFMSFFAGLGLIPTIQSCTYNISMAHTEGVAHDTIDDTSTNSPDVKPNISLTGLPL